MAQRELKFRAWHWDGKDMYNFDLEEIADGYILGTGLKLANMKIMQFTGLKDSKEVDIYEGDIVKYKRECFDKDETYTVDVINEVIFIFGEFKHRDSHFGWEGESLIPLDECEIIGNIYENPDLIK